MANFNMNFNANLFPISLLDIRGVVPPPPPPPFVFRITENDLLRLTENGLIRIIE